LKHLDNITRKCRSNKIAKTEKDFKRNRKRYDACLQKYKKRSSYFKKLTQRKKCEDKKCKMYQKNIQKILFTKNGK